MESPSLEQLAEQARTREMKSVELLIRGFHDPLFQFLYQLRVPEKDIDDLAQDVTMNVYTNIEQYHLDRPFLPWLFGIARNKVAEYWRTRLRYEKRVGAFQRYALERMEDVPPSDTTAHTRLDECVGRLPVGQRRILELRYREDLDSQGIAERIGRTSTSVRQILSRTRRVLRQCLEGGAIA